MLVQQTAAAAQSSATYGFNAGLQLDIAASKTDSSLDATSSVASTINGNNINIVTGGDGQSGNTLIQGSALNANQNLNIFTGELNVLASQDTMRSETDTQSGSMTIAQTVWGAAGGPTVSASLNSSQQQDKQTTHTNSSLTADNLNIVTSGDANIIGGNLHGATAVNMDIGGDLTLESVQDRFSGSNKGFGISGGAGFDGSIGNASSVNGGINASNGRYQTTETVLSSITGGTVNIDVNGNTQLTGALIAALDAEGNDTGNLSLNTGSLSFTDQNNRSYSSNQSFGVNGSVGVSDAANPADPNQSNTDLALNSSNYSYQNGSSQSLDKTLATIGQGSITVGGEDASPEGLNRDVDNINKELYAVDRQQGNIDLTIDHRLLTEEGRKQIAEDIAVVKDAAGEAANAIAEGIEVVTDALGITNLTEEERLALADAISAEFSGGLDGINAKNAAKQEAEKQAFAAEFDSLLADMGLNGGDILGSDGQPLTGELIVYVDQIRSAVMASQEDGVNPIQALITLEKLKADIDAIPSADISNPERKADAAEIITGMQNGILERMALSDALGMVGLPVTTRKIIIDAGKEIVEGGTEVVGPVYQKLKNLIAGKGPDVPDYIVNPDNLGDVWKLKSTERGTAIETYLAKTEYSLDSGWYNVGAERNGYFPLVDFQNGNTLVSLKSVDTTGKTWLSRMQDHIADLGSNGARVNDAPANMVLDIRVQPGGAHAAQELIQYGRDNNVTVIIKEFE